jgi:cytochrome c553
MACTACHGSDLNGVGNIPPLAGRSPSYLVRQLVDFQHGTRSGPSAVLMKEPVARLTIDDMVAIAAYLASRKP